jgi:glycopeptide antibiotics resistance protein
MRMTKHRTILAALLIAYIVFLLDIALFHFPSANPTPNTVPFRSMIADWKSGGLPFVVNFLGNIVAFVPMGLLPPLIRRRPTKVWHVLLFSVVISLIIEVGQRLSGRRVPDVDDLILNTLGGLIGYLLAGRIKRAGPARAGSDATPV